MKTIFRIKEVRNERTNSAGYKASYYYPQVKTFFNLFWRNIRPSEMAGEEFKGDAIRFRDIQNCKNFITLYKREKNVVQLKRDIKKVYHVVDAEA